MNDFERAGEAMALGYEGQRQVALAMTRAFARLAARFGTWIKSMPGTLPPTEFRPRR